MNVEEYPELCQRLYDRAKEVQPNLSDLIKDLRAMGMKEEDISIEIAFSLIHEGYRIRDLEDVYEEP